MSAQPETPGGTAALRSRTPTQTGTLLVIPAIAGTPANALTSKVIWSLREAATRLDWEMRSIPHLAALLCHSSARIGSRSAHDPLLLGHRDLEETTLYLHFRILV